MAGGELQDVVFLLDVDNTLLDNDGVLCDLRERLIADFGAERASLYWAHFEALRDELGYVDYLGALQRFRHDIARADGSAGADEHRLLQMAGFLLDYPFAERLYPRALDVLRHLGQVATTVLLTDGDVVLQPRKVQRSGLWDAVDGRVLIQVHKEQRLEAVRQQFPARRYVMVDDKLRILSAMKAAWGERLIGVFPRQGQYAHEPQHTAGQPAPDVTIERIGELADIDVARWLSEQAARAASS